MYPKYLKYYRNELLDNYIVCPAVFLGFLTEAALNFNSNTSNINVPFFGRLLVSVFLYIAYAQIISIIKSFLRLRIIKQKYGSASSYINQKIASVKDYLETEKINFEFLTESDLSALKLSLEAISAMNNEEAAIWLIKEAAMERSKRHIKNEVYPHLFLPISRY